MSSPFPLLIDGRIHSGYFTFIRSAVQYSDDEILIKLGLFGYKFVTEERAGFTYVHIAEDKEWIHIADDDQYTLWNDESVRARVAEIGLEHEVFTCSVGDIDMSFDLAHFRDGELKRRFVVRDQDCMGVRRRHHQGCEVAEDVGEQLPHEQEAMRSADPLDVVISLAESLGIDTDHKASSIRSYGKERDR